MRCMILIKADQYSEAGVMPEEKLLTDMGNYNEALVKAGIMLGGEGLHPSSRGVRVKFSGRDREVTHGPFAEINELICGFWLWNVESMDEAIEWVKQCPSPLLTDAVIEIRPLFEMDDFVDVFSTETTTLCESGHEWYPEITQIVQTPKKGESAVRCMILIKANKDTEAGVMPDESMFLEMGRFNEELVKAGIMLAGEGLKPTSHGARVQFSGDARTVVDGPFPETKELICGFWIWKVSSLEEAVEWVKRCPNPHAGDAEIEIRPIFEAEDFGDEFTPELREQEERLRAQLGGQ